MKLKLGAKLGVSFSIILVLMLIGTALTYLKAEQVRVVQDRIATVRIPTIVATKELQREQNQAGSKARQAVLAANSKERFSAAQSMYADQVQLINKDLARLTELAPRWTLEENRNTLTGIKQEVPVLLQEFQEAIDAAGAGGKEAVEKGGAIIDEKAITQNTAIKKKLEEMSASQEKLLKEDQEFLGGTTVSMVWTLGITSLLALAVGSFIAVALSRQISSATSTILDRATSIAANDLSGDDVNVRTGDELGELAAAVNSMQASLRNVIQSIAENAQNVANASEEFSSVSQQITANSEETSAQANAVSSATEEVNRNLQTVATATEEMSASISEIAKNATEAAKVAGEAMKTATETNSIVGKLGESSAEIGAVIKVITSIAQKTDLLALNATVEAARAGEVGAGFAVVANEVKELAKQTAGATEDISRRIAAIQTDTKSAVEAITGISGIIGQVNQISGTIAAAVEEQSATTNEMSRNLTDAAKGAGEVSQNISGVAQAAQNTSQGATDSLKAAQQLAKMSTQLRGLVEKFKLDGTRPSRYENGPHAPRADRPIRARQRQEEALVR